MPRSQYLLLHTGRQRCFGDTPLEMAGKGIGMIAGGAVLVLLACCCCIIGARAGGD